MVIVIPALQPCHAFHPRPPAPLECPYPRLLGLTETIGNIRREHVKETGQTTDPRSCLAIATESSRETIFGMSVSGFVSIFSAVAPPSTSEWRGTYKIQVKPSSRLNAAMTDVYFAGIVRMLGSKKSNALRVMSYRQSLLDVLLLRRSLTLSLPVVSSF